MHRLLSGFVKRGVRAVGSRLVQWLRRWTKPDNHGLVGGAVADTTRSKAELMLEVAQQLREATPFGERFLGSLRRGCLDYRLILSERHLRRVVTEYVTYFNQARPHQGINQRIPCASHLPDHPDGEMVGIVLGGLHHGYRRKAA
jgi:putative transposase